MNFGDHVIDKSHLTALEGVIKDTSENAVLFTMGDRDYWIPKIFFEASETGKYYVPTWYRQTMHLSNQVRKNV